MDHNTTGEGEPTQFLIIIAGLRVLSAVLLVICFCVIGWWILCSDDRPKPRSKPKRQWQTQRQRQRQGDVEMQLLDPIPRIEDSCINRPDGCCLPRNNICCYYVPNPCCERGKPTKNCDFRRADVGNCHNEARVGRCCLQSERGCCSRYMSLCCRATTEACKTPKCDASAIGCCIELDKGGCCKLKDGGCCNINGAKNCTNGGFLGVCPDPSVRNWAGKVPEPCCKNRRGKCCVERYVCCTDIPELCTNSKNEARQQTRN